MSSKDSFGTASSYGSTFRSFATGITDKSDRFYSTPSTIVRDGILFRDTSGLNNPGPGDYSPPSGGLLKKSFNVRCSRPRSSNSNRKYSNNNNV